MKFSVLRAAALLLLAGALPALAQESVRSYRIGVLSPTQASVDLVRRYALPELAQAGFVEGRNLQLSVRVAGGDLSRLPSLAEELAVARVDLVIAVSNPAIAAARQALPATPVVMSYGDEPVARGFAASLAQPGGMVTGIAMQARESNLKRLEIMRQLLPAARRIGVLAPAHFADDQRQELRRAAAGLGAELVFADAAQRADFDKAFAALRQGRAEAAFTVSHPGYTGDAAELSRHAVAQKLPLLCEWRDMAAAGCLFSFGPTHAELRTRTGVIAVRMLRGDAPGTIPIEQPSRFELVVNLATARALGLNIPKPLLLRADEVIE
jgi:putative ABC transport system substrate-binding protein